MALKQRLLAIETSSPRLSLAVGTETGLIKEYQGPLAWRHAESLFEGMEKLLKGVGWPVQSLTGVLVSTGPGSFTGIRIGLAAARALGQSLKVPVVGVASLETLAAGSLKPGQYVCPLIDALRGEVFSALYFKDSRGKIRTLWKEGRWALPDLLRKLAPLAGDPLLFVGDAADIYKKDLRTVGGTRWSFASAKDHYPKAGVLMERGWEKLSRSRAASYQQVLPLYLRSPAAVERRKR